MLNPAGFVAPVAAAGLLAVEEGTPALPTGTVADGMEIVGVLVPAAVGMAGADIGAAPDGRNREGGKGAGAPAIPGRIKGTVAAGVGICGRGAIVGGMPGALGRVGMMGAPCRESGTVVAWGPEGGIGEEGGRGAPR